MASALNIFTRWTNTARLVENSALDLRRRYPAGNPARVLELPMIDASDTVVVGTGPERSSYMVDDEVPTRG